AAVELTLAEGQTERAVLKLVSKPKVVETPHPKPPEVWSFAPGLHRTGAFVGIGVGGAGLITGVILTGVIASKKKFLDGEGGCQQGLCPSTVQADVDLYNGLRIGATVSYIAGIAFAGA